MPLKPKAILPNKHQHAVKIWEHLLPVALFIGDTLTHYNTSKHAGNKICRIYTQLTWRRNPIWVCRATYPPGGRRVPVNSRLQGIAVPTDFNKANRNSMRKFFKLIVWLRSRGNRSSRGVEECRRY